MSAADEYRRYVDRLMKMRRRGKPSVDNDTEANWCLRQLAELEERLAARANFVQLEMARLQQWLSKQRKADAKKAAFLYGLLKTYAASLQMAGKLLAGETYALPYGTLALKQQTPRLVTDEPALLVWAQAERPDLVLHNTSIDWNRLRLDLRVDGNKVIDVSTGNAIDGLKVVQLEPLLVVTPTNNTGLSS